MASFNPRTYIRYDTLIRTDRTKKTSFNPRTYIRYDIKISAYPFRAYVSIHVPI